MDNWKNILDENILKTNINFAAVFVMNYECLKEFVIEQVRDFYSEHFYMDGDRIVCEESNAYKEKVRALDKNLENASLKWFMDAEAITQEDYDRYQIIRKKRNDITHKLLKNLNEGFGEEVVQLFGDMMRIYNKLDKWWINEIEIPTSADDIPEDYDRNGVCGGQALILSIINEIIFGNEGDKYKELLNEFMKNKNDM
ncbi:MAG TPA: hypothetical protein DFH32_02950 [Lachnospiraceae bacterium]|nr:hypothetical protein [Lachnospiraceae bacterium]HCX41486.1 hypothetical protein [Lachnospiraceae bacterium]